MAVDLRLNYKAGTTEPELPYKVVIAFDDPRLAMARPQLPENLPKPYQSVPAVHCHAHCLTIMGPKNLAALWVVKLLFRPTRG